METARTLPPRSLLFVPASRPRMIAKAAGLAADWIVLDLEDAVRDDAKDAARAALPESMEVLAGRAVAVRINALDGAHRPADLAAIDAAGVTTVVVPKVESVAGIAQLADSGRSVMAMIETPAGVQAASAIAAAPGLAALIVGTNDLAAGLRLPPSSGRAAMGMALQGVVLAARAAGVWAIDGVFNALSDPEGLERECAEGRALGYDGKSLIHPDQVAIANAAFGPTNAELADAHALIAAAGGGAERFRDRMVEDLHVEMARALIERAR
ncbi:HpcH/HpaI aldolase/citrate lyase family protein [Sphingomonas sp. CFBP 13720]|uniref:HpcH/HpaI aldolase/citrate lyase family protein n=1 Tax=Sphingomonas sp. CFBP 13720 TaxID=2775302 RepID=UPI0017846D40|nr:CoA ester lyase [Sphingomonas sp. CFBP 13720]MBD8679529.1 CoA ester lyase [Sphingomonas sp. CFBP 13720]